MADLEIGAKFNGGGISSGTQEAVATVKSGTQAMSDAFEQHAETVSKALKEAGKASKAMGSELGGEVIDLISLMPELAAAIEAATSATGVIALVGVLAQVAEKVYDLISSWSELSDAEKTAITAAANETKKALEFDQRILEKRREIELVGKSAVQQAQLRAHWAEEDNRYEEKTLQRARERYERAKETIDLEGQYRVEVVKSSLARLGVEYKKVVPLVSNEQLLKAKATIADLEALYGAGLRDLDRQTLTSTENRALAEANAAEAIRQQHKKIQEERHRADQIEQDAAIAHTQALGGIEKQRLEFEHRIGQLSDDEYESRLQGQLALTYAETRQELEIKLKAAEKQPEEYARIKAEFQKLDDQYQAQSEKEEQEAAVRKQQRVEAEQKKLAEIRKRVHDIEQDADTAHLEALNQIKIGEIEFERQIGRTSESEYEKRLQQQLKLTYDTERKKLQIEEAAAAKDPVEHARVLEKIQKLDDKYLADSEKREQQSLLRRRQKFDQHFQQIAGEFNTALNSWIQGTEKASQAFSKMFESILMSLVGFVEKWIEKKIEMWLMDEILGDSGQQAETASTAESNVAQIESDAFFAAAQAYAVNAWDPPAAALAADEAFAAVSALGIGAGAVAAFEKGGVVPATGLALVHEGERILPRSLSGDGRGLVAGSQFVFAPTIHALDAEGVDRVLIRHQRIFENRVDKVLKKRGFFAK